MNPWERDWGGGASAAPAPKPAAALDAAPPDAAPSGAKPWERDWGKMPDAGPAKPTKKDAEVPSGPLKGNQRILANIAGIADVVLGLPSMAASVIGETGGRIGTAAAGGSRKEAAEEGQRIGQEFAAPLADPVQRLMRHFGYLKDYDESDVTHALSIFTSWINKGGEWIEKKTNGAILKEDAELLTNAIMTGGPVELVKKAGGALKPGAKPAVVEPPVKPRTEPGPLTPLTEADFTDAKEFGDHLKAQEEEQVQVATRVEPTEAAQRAERPFSHPYWTDEKLSQMAEIAERRVTGAHDRRAEIRTTEGRRGRDPKRPATPEADLADENVQYLESAYKQIRDEQAHRASGGKALAVGIGVAAAAAAMSNPDVRDKAATGATVAMLFVGMPEGGRAIGPVLKSAAYGSRVLERLAERSPGKIEFGKQELQSEINRQDIPKPEREVLEKVLGQLPGESVRAADLMHHFQLETQNFELEPTDVARFADYGLHNIGATDRMKSRTSVWKLPDTWDIPARGHFDNLGPNQYGHTRSFDREGVRHVVELQSDLQQHLAPLSAEQIKANEEEVRVVSEGENKLKDEEALLRTGGVTQALREWPRIWNELAWTPRFMIGSWTREHTPTLADLHLRKADPAVQESVRDLKGAQSAIQEAYGLKAKVLRYNTKQKRFEKIQSFKIAPRQFETKTAPGGRTVLEATDAWQVEMELQPRDSMDSKDTGTPRRVVEAVDESDIIRTLVNDGWTHHNLLGMLRGVGEHLKIRKGEISATLGDEPGKAATREKLRPIGEKMWPRRLIQEEIARAGQEGMGKVRFATADTVAKVESWRKEPDTTKAVTIPDAIATLEKDTHFPELEGRTVYFRVEDKAPFEQRKLTGWVRVAESDEGGTTGLLEYETLGGEKAVLGPSEVAHVTYPPDAQLKWSQQRIYDRYADEIAKYLKALGGKEVTDAHGTTWHEVPVRGAGQGPYPPRMFGKADPRYLARLAALGVGAAAGAYYQPDNKLMGMLEGTIVAAGGLLAATRFHDTLRNVQRPDTRIRISRIGDDREELIHRLAIDTWRAQGQVEKLVPKVAEREHLARWLRGDKTQPLNAAQQKALPLLQKWFTTPGLGGRTLKAAQARFDLQAKGLTDVSTIMGVYGNAIARSVADARMLDALEGAKDPAGNGLIAPTRNPPQGYVHVEHPLLQGYVVHPDIESSLKHLLDTPHPAAAKRIAMALVMGTKRALVSFSLFHATALSFAAQAASSNPVKFVKLYAQAAAPRIFGENIFLKQLREQGHAGTMIDKAVQGGLMWSLGREHAGVEDVGNFYAGMQDIVKLADDVFPGLSMPVRKIIQLNQKFDGFMWDRLHAGTKLSLFAEKYQQLMENNALAHAKDPGKVKLMSEREAARISAAFGNAIFGGLNWRRAAEAVRNKIGRDVALGVFAPSARKIAQVTLFAPDWLVSTTLPWINAFGKGTGIKGILNAQTLADLNRQYLIRSGLFYLVVGDAINHAMSGHHLWDNKDPFVVEMDNKGERHMIFNKHFMEVIHAIQHPAQTALSKMSYPVKEGLNQLFGTEYLAPHVDKRSGQVMAGPGMEGGRGAHAIRGLSPIAVQQGFGGGAGQGAAGFFGLPIYGKTREQRRKESEERRRRRVRERIDAILESTR